MSLVKFFAWCCCITNRVTKTVSSRVVSTGSTFTYTLLVESLGPNPAANVLLTDAVPAGLAISSVVGPCTTTGQTVSCNFGTLPVGNTRTVTIAASAVQPGIYDNAAVITADNDEFIFNNEDSVSMVVFSPTCGLADPSITSYECAHWWLLLAMGIVLQL